jgi:hypothetical protein
MSIGSVARAHVWLAYKVLDLSNALWFAGIDGLAVKGRAAAKLIAGQVHHIRD